MKNTTTKCLRLSIKRASFITQMGQRHMSSLPVQLHLHFWDRMKMELHEDTSTKTSKQNRAFGSDPSSQVTSGIPTAISSERIQMELILSGTESQVFEISSSPTSNLIVYKPIPTDLVSSKDSTGKTKSLLCIGSKTEK